MANPPSPNRSEPERRGKKPPKINGRHVWSDFQMLTLVGLMIRGYHNNSDLESTKQSARQKSKAAKHPHRAIANAINKAMDRHDMSNDIPLADISKMIKHILENNKGFMDYLKYNKAGRLTRSLSRRFARNLNFDGSIEEWESGRKAAESARPKPKFHRDDRERPPRRVERDIWGAVAGTEHNATAGWAKAAAHTKALGGTDRRIGAPIGHHQSRGFLPGSLNDLVTSRTSRPTNGGSSMGFTPRPTNGGSGTGFNPRPTNGDSVMGSTSHPTNGDSGMGFTPRPTNGDSVMGSTSHPTNGGSGLGNRTITPNEDDDVFGSQSSVGAASSSLQYAFDLPPGSFQFSQIPRGPAGGRYGRLEVRQNRTYNCNGPIKPDDNVRSNGIAPVTAPAIAPANTQMRISARPARTEFPIYDDATLDRNDSPVRAPLSGTTTSEFKASAEETVDQYGKPPVDDTATGFGWVSPTFAPPSRGHASPSARSDYRGPRDVSPFAPSRVGASPFIAANYSAADYSNIGNASPFVPSRVGATPFVPSNYGGPGNTSSGEERTYRNAPRSVGQRNDSFSSHGNAIAADFLEYGEPTQRHSHTGWTPALMPPARNLASSSWPSGRDNPSNLMASRVSGRLEPNLGLDYTGPPREDPNFFFNGHLPPYTGLTGRPISGGGRASYDERGIAVYEPRSPANSPRANRPRLNLDGYVPPPLPATRTPPPAVYEPRSPANSPRANRPRLNLDGFLPPPGSGARVLRDVHYSRDHNVNTDNWQPHNNKENENPNRRRANPDRTGTENIYRAGSLNPGSAGDADDGDAIDTDMHDAEADFDTDMFSDEFQTRYRGGRG